MGAILSITFPIYAAIAIGYLAVKRGWFDRADMRVLGKYVLNIALPALLFNAVASRDFSEVIHPGYMLVFAAGGLGTIAVSFSWFTFTGIDKGRRAVAVMGSSCPNSAYVGYPVLLLTLPDLAGVILALNTLIEVLLVVPLCLFLMDMARHERAAPLPVKLVSIFWGVTKRPMVIGLLLGLAVSVAGLPVPDTVSRLLSMLAASASALSLVAIGNAPTALFRVLETIDAGGARPALVIAFPVGFVGAAESKAELADNPRGLDFVTLIGRRGGSAMASSVVNALAYLATGKS